MFGLFVSIRTTNAQFGVEFDMSYSKLIPNDEVQPAPIQDKTFYLTSEALNSESELAHTSYEQENAMAPARERAFKQHGLPEAEHSVISSHYFGKRTDKRHLVHDLTEAVECGNFRISFQPIVSLRDGALTGAETCLQWKNRGKFVPASHFIPLAASCGLIDSLGAWVIRHACALIKPIMAELPPGFRLTVNVLPPQLESDCMLFAIEEGLASMHIKPENFEIEIYDQIQGCSKPIIRKTIEAVRRMGVSVALDEFGASFSSVESLLWLRVNRIKFHKSLSSATRIQWPVLDGMAQMAKVLRIPIVATGIGALRQLERVRSVGCEEAQGELIAKSASASELLLLSRQEMDSALLPGG